MNPQATISQLEDTSRILGNDLDRLMLELGKISLPPGTCRWRMVKCGKCEHLHGPYLYVYRREKGHLEEVYMSKDGEAAQQISRAMELSKLIRAKIREMNKVERRIDKLKLREAHDERPKNAKIRYTLNKTAVARAVRKLNAIVDDELGKSRNPEAA